MIRTAILGASGYVGGELLRLIAAHPELAPAKLYGESKAGQPIGAVHPHLAAIYRDAVFEKFDGSLDGVDLVFAALPHGHSQRLAASILDSGVPLVDLGADFRLDDAATYERWYGHAHEAPELLGRFVYGIPELNREAIKSAKAMSAAGCYATAAILALKPLVDAGLVKPDSLIVDAASGVSGAGREAKESTGFSTVDGSFSAYGLLNHRHTAEMEMAIAGTVLFTPHLVPMTRGILATCYVRTAAGVEPAAAQAHYRKRYEGSPFVRVLTDKLPETKATQGSNFCDVAVLAAPAERLVVAVAALDNLVKGASGQAIQCMNLMFGLKQEEGLWAPPLYP